MLYILLLLIPLAIYAVSAMALLFYLKRYNIDAGLTKKLSAAFIAVSVVLAFLTSLAFFSIPWNNLRLNELFGNFLPPYSSPININY